MELNLGIAWQFGDASSRLAPALLFSLLRDTGFEGSLSAAAKLSGVSYRTAWNLINDWSRQLGGELLVSHRGKGAILSPLGLKLLWSVNYAEEQTRGILDATSRKIKTELDLVGGQFGDELLSICASHCLSHNILSHLFRTRSGRELRIRNNGSSKSLSLLQQGRCGAAGFHLPDGELRAELIRAYKHAFDPLEFILIHSATRKQGLIVQRGNPKGIHSIQDLARVEIRMVNRQADSGTRLLLDALLAQGGISVRSIKGYDNTEFTHSAVSARVADGSADVAVGTEASAVQFGLDFIVLATETYFYAVHRETANAENIQILRSVLASSAWRQAIRKLDGYDPTDSGLLLDAVDVFGSV